MIKIKTLEELDKIRRAGEILAKIAVIIKKQTKAGITTKELDKIAEDQFAKFSAVSAFKGYRGFPANICTSINEEVVHGIPSDRKILEGDLVSVDLGIKYNDYYADMAFTEPIGKIDAKEVKLITVTKEALKKGIKQARVNNRISDISCEIQKYVESAGFSVVREFVGHGIGSNLHEEPQIPNFGVQGTGEIIKEGMVFAIEPMVNMGSWQVEVLDNGWTAVAKDKKPSCHFEHTIAVLKEGPKIFTE